jgi:hypothetical protein
VAFIGYQALFSLRVYWRRGRFLYVFSGIP